MMLPPSACILFWLFGSTVLAAQLHTHDASFTPDITLSITQQNISIGGMYRYTTLVNGSLPGPTLRIPENEVVWIRVYNDMTDANATMHWHGLAQAAYPFSDGTPLASQWPIPPGYFFDYELSSPKGTAGTYYYHSHVGFSTSSATGALIIEDPDKPPYDYDEERIIFLQEYWNQTDAQMIEHIEGSLLTWPGQPNGWLINGKSISNWESVDQSSKALSVIEVQPNKSYRFRFIAATSLSLALLAVENHTNFDIIEADGAYTKPQGVEVLQMGSGQRYDAILQTKSCDELKDLGKLDYYIQLESRERDPLITNYAILRYHNACNLTEGNRVPTHVNPDQRPMTLPATDPEYLNYQLQPLVDNNFPSASDVTRRIILNQQEYVVDYPRWHINNNTWMEDGDLANPHTTPYEPYLVALYRNQTQNLPDYDAAVANGGLDPKTKTYPAKLGEVLEIVIQNVGAHTASDSIVPPGSLDTHPWHSHGMHFYDLGSGEGAYDPEVMEQRLKGTHPVRRDTTVLYKYSGQGEIDQAGSWRAWRLRVEDPGVWMVHCHTLQHMIQGMQTVWVHGEAKDILKVGYPDVEGYLTYGGDVVGNDTRAPSVVHFSELV